MAQTEDCNSPIKWATATPDSANRYAHEALVAGHEGSDRSTLWAIRARHNNDMVPGKFVADKRNAFIPYEGKEVSVQNFEVLCARSNNVRWVSDSNGSVPPKAVPGGSTDKGQTLYVGRAPHENSLTPGKIHPANGCIYISYDGLEHSYTKYEVLCTL